jgi:hypothetical protein
MRRFKNKLRTLLTASSIPVVLAISLVGGLGGQAMAVNGDQAVSDSYWAEDNGHPDANGTVSDSTDSAYAMQGDCDLLGTWCGRFGNQSPNNIGLIHNWYADSRLAVQGVLPPTRYSESYPLYWRDTDGFYVGANRKVLIQYGGTYHWYYWYNCTYVNNYCKVGFFKLGNLGPGAHYWIKQVVVIA